MTNSFAMTPQRSACPSLPEIPVSLQNNATFDDVITSVKHPQRHARSSRGMSKASSEIAQDIELDALVASVAPLSPASYVGQKKGRASLNKPTLLGDEAPLAHEPYAVHPSFVPATSQMPRPLTRRARARSLRVLSAFGKDLLLVCGAVLVVAVSLVAAVLLVPMLGVTSQAVALAVSGSVMLLGIQPVASRISSLVMRTLFGLVIAALVLAATWILRLVVLAGHETPLDLDLSLFMSGLSRLFDLQLFSGYQGMALIFEAALLLCAAALVTFDRREG